MRKIDVPYLLNYQDEEKIYNRGLRMARRYHRIAPHTTEMAALWAVMSRVHKSDLTHSTDLMEETRQVLGKLTPIAKTLLYAGEYALHFPAKSVSSSRAKCGENCAMSFRTKAWMASRLAFFRICSLTCAKTTRRTASLRFRCSSFLTRWWSRGPSTSTFWHAALY